MHDPVSFWFGGYDSLPQEYRSIIDANRKRGLTLLELPDQKHDVSARHTADRIRFEMALEDPTLRYLDCDTLMLGDWPVLPADGIPRFANHFGVGDTWAIDFNGVDRSWIKKILDEWTDRTDFINGALLKYRNEWTIFPNGHFTHKPWITPK